MDAVAADRRIAGQGTPEAAWQQWPGLAALPEHDAAALLPPGRRAVVVAPHPDDEVLACGGLIAQWAAAGRCVQVVAVTDGEASLPAARVHGAEALGALRRREREAGLACLGLAAHDVVALGLPDGGVGRETHALAARLAELLRPGDVVLAPWRRDGHPDHEAVGEAAARACVQRGLPLHELPIWMWHWARPDDPRVPWARLRRVAVRHAGAKAEALRQHHSQLLPAGGEPPTLPPWALARWQRSFEYVFEAGA